MQFSYQHSLQHLQMQRLTTKAHTIIHWIYLVMINSETILQIPNIKNGFIRYRDSRHCFTFAPWLNAYPLPLMS